MDLDLALERFLGSSPSPLRTVIVRHLARATFQAWRDGLITTAQVLRTLGDSYEAMRALDS